MFRQQERIYLSKRKGFVKVALQAGADLVPVYILGQSQASGHHCWLVMASNQMEALHIAAMQQTHGLLVALYQAS